MQIGNDAPSTLSAVLPGQTGTASVDTASAPAATGTAKNPDATAKKDTKGQPGDSLQLSPDAQRQVDKLKARDQEVRAHEAAHMAAGGGLVRGGASYSYQQGPDGKRYAVGGEVSIDSSPVRGNPRATEMKAQQIEASALAPADPSGQDRKVAAQAAQMVAQAAAELAKSATQGSGSAKTTGTQIDLMA